MARSSIPGFSHLGSSDHSAAWPAQQLRAGGDAVLIDELSERFAALPSGEWSEPPTQALVVPLPDQGRHGQPYRTAEDGSADRDQHDHRPNNRRHQGQSA